MVMGPSLNFNNLFYQIGQDWFVFILIFIITFALVYMALSRFFTKKSDERIDLRTGKWKKSKKYIENQSVVVLISVCVALLVTIGFFQSQYYQQAYSFLFSGLNVLFPLVLLGGFIALIFKKFSKSVGSLFAIEFVILIVWGFAKYLYSSDFVYSIPYGSQQFLFVISSFWALAIALSIGLIIGLIWDNVVGNRAAAGTP